MVDQHGEMQVNSKDNLEVIREEQSSPLASIIENEEEEKIEKDSFFPTMKCVCGKTRFEDREELDALKLHQILQENEKALREQFQKKLDDETGHLKEKFNFILQ